MCHKHIIIFIIPSHCECASGCSASVHFIIIPNFLLLHGWWWHDDYNILRRTADKVVFLLPCHEFRSHVYSLHTHTMTEDGNIIKSLVLCQERGLLSVLNEEINRQRKSEWKLLPFVMRVPSSFWSLSLLSKTMLIGTRTLADSTWLASKFHNRRSKLNWFFSRGPKLT